MKGLMEEIMPDTGYGCVVTNRFGTLLDDQADPFDVLNQASTGQERKKKKKKEEMKKPPAPPAKSGKESQRDRKSPRDGDSAGNTRAVEGPKRPVQPEERKERRVAFSEPKFSEGEEPQGYFVERPVEPFDRAGRGRGGGRGRGARGGGYPRSTDGFDPRGKREFERHSGSDRTSVRSEEKRGGGGPRNWGSVKDHLSAVADGVPGESEEVADTAETGGNQPLETEEVIEVAIEMSLDEWKALQEQSRPKSEFNIRKAETSVPSKAVEHGNGVNEDAVFRRSANDITFQLEINFGSLGRPSRGGRGGRGGRGRGAAAAAAAAATPRSPEKFVEVAPNPDDPEDFPALA